jgi:uncharacterized protein (DUF1778 family)
MGRRGRPRMSADDAKVETIEIRVSWSEKQAFREAATTAGLALSSWIRDRLRRAATRNRRGLRKRARSAKRSGRN